MIGQTVGRRAVTQEPPPALLSYERSPEKPPERDPAGGSAVEQATPVIRRSPFANLPTLAADKSLKFRKDGTP